MKTTAKEKKSIEKEDTTMKTIFSSFKTAVAALAALLLPCALMAATNVTEPTSTGGNNNLLALYKYNKGFLATIFNSENDQMTYLVGGKYWKVTYKPEDGTEITVSEYVYNADGSIAAVKNPATGSMTVYKDGKSSYDVNAQGIVTARYEYSGSGNLIAKHMYGYIGETNGTASDWVNIDPDNSAADVGYAEVQQMTFKDGKQYQVKTMWMQVDADPAARATDDDNDPNTNSWSDGSGAKVWVRAGSTIQVGNSQATVPAGVTTEYVWSANNLVAVLSGNSIKPGANNTTTGVESVMLYKSGKEGATYKVGTGTAITIDSKGNVKVPSNATGGTTTLDGTQTDRKSVV